MKSPLWTWLKNSKVGGKKSCWVLESSPWVWGQWWLAHYPLVPSLSAGWAEKCVVKYDQIMGSVSCQQQFVADILVLMQTMWLFTTSLWTQHCVSVLFTLMLTKYLLFWLLVWPAAWLDDSQSVALDFNQGSSQFNYCSLMEDFHHSWQ